MVIIDMMDNNIVGKRYFTFNQSLSLEVVVEDGIAIPIAIATTTKASLNVIGLAKYVHEHSCHPAKNDWTEMIYNKDKVGKKRIRKNGKPWFDIIFIIVVIIIFLFLDFLWEKKVLRRYS